jgi:hypothetical protein
MSLVQISNSTPRGSIPFSILDLKAQAVRLPVSKASQILLSEFLTWAGERGYCWWSIPKIAADLNWSVSVVWRKSKELKQAGLLEVIPRPGRSNYWVPLPGKTKMERLQKELTPLAKSRGHEKKTENSSKRSTVQKDCTSTPSPSPSPEPQNVNAIKSCPHKTAPLQGTTSDTTLDSPEELIPVVQTPPQSLPFQQKPAPPVAVAKTKAPITSEHLCLVEEIERVTGDTWSRGHFVNIVRQIDEQTVYAALSVTREKMAMESGVNGGAYFTSTVRGMTALVTLGVKPLAEVMPKQSIPDYPTTPPPPPTPRFVPYQEPEPESLDPESLKKGFRLQYKGAGVDSMLSLVQRCVPVSVDVRSLWVDVRETFAGMEESVLIDRLLDTVVSRIKHAERMTEVLDLSG